MAQVQHLDVDDAKARKKESAEADFEFFKGIKRRRMAALEFWKLVGEVPVDSWGRFKAYLYRTWPRIDRKLVNPDSPTSIEIIDTPFDADYILKHHGEGDYEIKLIDSGRPENSQMVCMCYLKLRSPDFPPVIDQRELDMGYDGNRSYVEGLRARGLLGKQPDKGNGSDASLVSLLREMIMQQRRDPQNTGEGQAVSKALDIVSRGADRSVEMILAQVKQQDPAFFIQMIEQIKGLMPKDDSARLLDTVLKIQSDNTKAMIDMQGKQTDLMLKLIESRTNRDDGLGSFDKIIGAFKSLRELTGEGGADRAPKWYEVLAPHAPAALGYIDHIVSNITSAVRAPRLPAPRPPGQAHAVEPPGVPAVESQPLAAEPGASQEQLKMLQAIAPHLMQFIANGREGWEFAAWIEDGYGALAYEQVAAIGQDGLMNLLRTSPLWAQLGPIEPRVAAFIASFIDWPEERRRQGEAEEEEVAETGLPKEREQKAKP